MLASFPKLNQKRSYHRPLSRQRALACPLPGLPEHLILLEQVGQGAMGTVYRVWDQRLRREVALKVSSHQTETNMLKRFEREMRATARISHPCVVQVYESFLASGRACYTMQMLDAISFDEIIEAGKSAETSDKYTPLLPLNDFARVFANVAEGLHAAHRAGVIHRDIKPSNLMLDDSNTPKLIDFGLARIAGQSKLTNSGEIIGSLRYMSPEQFNATTELSPASDIYSLGLTIQESLTGDLGFSDNSDGRIFYQVQNPHCRDRRRLQSLPAGMRLIIEKATARSPHSRYATAYQLAMDLRQFADSQSTLFAASSTLSNSSSSMFAIKQELKFRLLGVLATLALLVLLLSVGYFLLRLTGLK